MKRQLHLSAALALLALAGGCGNRDLAATSATTGVRQTSFPGQITAGGGTSGAVMARTARPETDATYAGGTPGIAGGSGGTTGGAATAGTVVEAGQGPSSGTAPVTGAGGAVPAATPAGAAAPGATPGTAPAPAAAPAAVPGATAPPSAAPAGTAPPRGRVAARRHGPHQRRDPDGWQPAAARPAQP